MANAQCVYLSFFDILMELNFWKWKMKILDRNTLYKVPNKIVLNLCSKLKLILIYKKYKLNK